MVSVVTSPPDFLIQAYGLASSLTDHVCIHKSDEPNGPSALVSPDPTRPYVTLTFAQSLDAKIAGIGGKQLAVSGRESLVMTHWMRTMHDAILVGIGTALNDDPQLNTRHLPSLPRGYPYTYKCPRPVILDAHLRLSPDCKLLKNYRAGIGRRPWVACSSTSSTSDEGNRRRREVLQAAGARIIEVTTENDLISIPHLLKILRELGVLSVMVEGGARVIQSFIASSGSGRHYPDHSRNAVINLIDMIIITVAPTLIGREGIGYGANLVSEELPAMEHVKTELFGHDAVISLRLG